MLNVLRGSLRLPHLAKPEARSLIDIRITIQYYAPDRIQLNTLAYATIPDSSLLDAIMGSVMVASFLG